MRSTRSLTTPSKLAVALIAARCWRCTRRRRRQGGKCHRGHGQQRQFRKRLRRLHAEQKAQGAPDSADLRNAVREELIRRELLLQEAKAASTRRLAVASQMEMARQAVLIRAFIGTTCRRTRSATLAEGRLRRDQRARWAAPSTRAATSCEDRGRGQDHHRNLKKGAKFEELAKQSEDPGSQGQRRRPRLERRRQLRTAVLRRAGRSWKDKVPLPDPGKTDFGWHVIQLEDTRPLEAPAFKRSSRNWRSANQQLIEKMIEGLRARPKVQ